ncbi:MAG: ligase-associated DNA damage response DEXH box helicase [Verrucomicrobiota bacterium]
MSLPEQFQSWFNSRGWQPYAHQLDVIDASKTHRDILLIAPTGGGKTLSGFLPGLIELAKNPPASEQLRMLYVSPLKALAADIERNLQAPLLELKLPLRCETRTGDTSSHRRAKQKTHPPHILLTTPESLALILSYADAAQYVRNLDYLILDELHALADSKRGDLLALNLARLKRQCPRLKTIGLSATVAKPSEMAAYLNANDPNRVRLINAYQTQALKQAPPEITLLTSEGSRLPWAGHSGRHILPEVYELIQQHQTTLVFVNTRSQAEFTYQDLQELNEDQLPIALHHGSLEKKHRLQVEADLASGDYRAVVATSSLDLGIDWGSVDLVIQIGPPKGVARLMQRIGRSNHVLDKSSKAIIAPTNRMETIEALSSIEAIRDNDLDNFYTRKGSLDVLIQHLIGRCCSEPMSPDDLFAEAQSALPFHHLTRTVFDQCLNFAATGGYALRAYDQFKKLATDENGKLRVATARIARNYRMNIGTIVGNTHLKIRLGRTQNLGEVEERFVQSLTPGDTFLFAGRLLEFKTIREMTVVVSPSKATTPKVPAYAGGKLPLSGTLARRVRERIAQPKTWNELPASTREWLEWQKTRSLIPNPDELLVESFPRQDLQFLATHCFAGKHAHHTLGMLITQRMEKWGLQPLGFSSNDYGLVVWSLKAIEREDQACDLLSAEVIESELQQWMDDSFMMKRTFRDTAVVAGLIERQLPGKRKSGRQVTFSSDVIYDVLRQYEPDHVLIQATREEAGRNLINSQRLKEVLHDSQHAIRFKRLDKISPFAIPIVLEVGKESIDGSAVTSLLELEASQLLEECGLAESSLTPSNER